MDIGDGISLIAVLIAFVSLYRTRKQNDIENKLNEASLKLTQLQLKTLEMEEVINNSADIGAYFYLDGKSQHRVAVCNKGNAIARNVNFNIKTVRGGKSPLVQGDFDVKFPASSLLPGEEIYLLAAITLDMSPAFDVMVSWDNPDGKSKIKEFRLSLPG